MQKTAEVSAVAFHGVTGRLFRAVYTGTRPGFPRHQGGEGVAGTPGACSQVFCHPIRCITRTRQDRLAVSLVICTTNTTRARGQDPKCGVDLAFFSSCSSG